MLSFLFSVIGVAIKVAFYGVIYLYIGIVELGKLMSKPFSLLLKTGKSFAKKHLGAADRLDSCFWAFNGFMPFLLFAAALIFAVVSFWISASHWDTNDNYLIDLIYNTTLGSFTGFLSGGLDFTPATIVAIAFSGTLMPLCMASHDPEFDRAPWYIRAVCYTVYLVAFSILARLLTGLFQTVGQWGYNTIVSLYNRKTEGFFATAGKVLPLIPLCYVALLLCLITVKTYAESLLFGFLGMIALFLVGWLLSLLPDTYPLLVQILSAVSVLGLFFGLDILQGKAVDRFGKFIEDTKREVSLGIK
ncbi:MAG: hypothetical protein J6Q92_07010 [Oscillospiraceae bacterium]|nr:hypothetical protein [Oscillospiraceae bacterium]